MKYKFNIKDLIRKFQEFNSKYFNNELPCPEFKITMTRHRLGCFKYHKNSSTPYEINVSHFLDRDEYSINETLIHEMIHLWQRVKYNEGNHGKTFKRKSDEIFMLSGGEYDIQRLSVITPDVKATVAKKDHTKLLIFDYNNRRCYAKPCKNRVELLVKSFKGHDKVKNMIVVEAYGDFSRIRTSVKLLNYRYIDNESDFNKKYHIKQIA